MSLLPTSIEQLARARADLRLGLPIVLLEGGKSYMVAAIETLTPERFAALGKLGPLTLGLSARRAQTLKIHVYDGDLARLSVPRDASIKWLWAMADPTQDLGTPLKGPFDTLRHEDPMPARAGQLLAKSARLLPSVVYTEIDDIPKDLLRLPAALVLDNLNHETTLHRISGAHVPLSISDAGKVHVFRPEHGGEEHFAIEIGRPDRDKPVLTRLHSACFTGDIFGSLKCDCGPQLHAALRMIAQNGHGVLLYLNQEGRDIGPANKMRAYTLQEQGFDTVEANHRLGFEDDERDFRIGAGILKELGISQVRLLTNNPNKLSKFTENGITVSERVPLKVGQTPQNAHYLATKAKKSGHLL